MIELTEELRHTTAEICSEWRKEKR
ncbi:MAG: hypothetical protein UZ07_CHB004002115, partial [Chlorobi bacterium OLB7]